MPAAKTIAVLAGGLDAIYPARHRKLAIDIIINNDGAIVSEQPEGMLSLPHRFLQRNWIGRRYYYHRSLGSQRHAFDGVLGAGARQNANGGTKQYHQPGVE